MTNFYDDAYWDTSLDERLARAREEYRRAKERLIRTQVDLADIPPTRSFVFEGASQAVAGTAGVFGPPIKGDALEALFGTDPERKRLWDRYLKDFEWYVRKKVGYDRLFAEAARQRLMNPENRPSETPTAPEYREAPLEVDSGDPWLLEMKDEVEEGLKKIMDLIRGDPDSVDYMPYRVGTSLARRRVRIALLYVAMAQSLDVEESPELSEALVDCRILFDRLVDDAERNFWSGCTKENLADWLELAQAVQALGETEDTVDLFRGNSASKNRHTVELGDTLRSIAKEYYDDECMWAGIYNFNIKQIGPNPELLTPGLTLKLP